MAPGKTIERGGDEILVLQPEASEISFPLNNDFRASTNVLIVDTDLITLQGMKKVMEKYGYEVAIYTDAKEAISFLTTCKNEINLVIWDFHMPEINGLQALDIIGSKMDLPVVIMSDDDKTESVMNATIHGSCDYVLKPVLEKVLGNIWQHIVRKKMMSKPGLPPVQLNVVQEEGDSMTVNQGNSEENIDTTEQKAAKKPRLTRIEEIQPIQSDSVQSKGSDQDNDGSRTVSQHNNGERKFKKEHEKVSRKPRMSWTRDLQQKFIQAIEIVGGPTKANPKLILKCMQEDMKVEGITRSNVSSHLQKYRLSLEENIIPRQMRETDHWSSASRPSPLIGLNDGLTATSSLMNGRATYPVQENQYRNGYLEAVTMNNSHGLLGSQFVTNTMPSLPYFDDDGHLQQQPKQQQYQLPHQLNNMMGANEPGQASGINLADLEQFFPSLPYDPNEFLTNGYNFNQ